MGERVRFKRLLHGVDLPLPTYKTPGSAGMDVCAAHDGQVLPGERLLMETGFEVAVPQGYELQCRPRSGNAAQHGVTVLNAPGTIDSDYRGEIKVVLINHDPKCTFFISKGDRIAQLVLAPVERAEPAEVQELDATERGAGGFGSTDRKFFGMLKGDDHNG